MQEHVTLLQPEGPAPGGAGVSSALPPDLLEQVRGRVRLLAALLLAGFAFDPAIFLLTWTASRFTGTPLPPEILEEVPFVLADAAGATASAAVWWLARQSWISPSRLLTVGLVYQVVICLQIGITMPWQFYLNEGNILPLTWTPTVIVLFPLIMPGPPRRMLAAAIAAGATGPLGLLLLDLGGKAAVDVDDYLRSIIAATIAVVFAYLGARVVYRLGREVSAARELGSYRLQERLGVGGMGEVWRARHRHAGPSGSDQAHPPFSPEERRRVGEPGAALRAGGAGHRPAPVSPHGGPVRLRHRGERGVLLRDGAAGRTRCGLPGAAVRSGAPGAGGIPDGAGLPLLVGGGVLRPCPPDIKPANIFLCRYGEDFDFVKVLDFGLVKAFGDREGPALTGENLVQGTPAFIAPEQALGEPDLDARVDIYALGCVAYWLLTGQFVFNADTTMGYLVHHIHTPPRPPSEVAGAAIPPALDHVILSCLAKDPAQRPQSARELSRRLTEVEGADRWTAVEAKAWWDEHLPGLPRAVTSGSAVSGPVT